MDSEVKERWIDGLRSGLYKQGRDYLYDSERGSYCCLGVLCSVEGMIVGDGNTHLPKDFREKVGLSSSREGTLIELNDDLHLSFEEIAGYIERNI